jgi:uncharacterized protein
LARQIYVNLPVKDFRRSVDFFTGLGCGFKQKYSDNDGACLIAGKDSYVMLLVDRFFRTVTKKELVGAKKSTGVMVCLTYESREQVDALVA